MLHFLYMDAAHPLAYVVNHHIKYEKYILKNVRTIIHNVYCRFIIKFQAPIVAITIKPVTDFISSEKLKQDAEYLSHQHKIVRADLSFLQPDHSRFDIKRESSLDFFQSD